MYSNHVLKNYSLTFQLILQHNPLQLNVSVTRLHNSNDHTFATTPTQIHSPALNNDLNNLYSDNRDDRPTANHRSRSNAISPACHKSNLIVVVEKVSLRLESCRTRNQFSVPTPRQPSHLFLPGSRNALLSNHERKYTYTITLKCFESWTLHKYSRHLIKRGGGAKFLIYFELQFRLISYPPFLGGGQLAPYALFRSASLKDAVKCFVYIVSKIHK